MSVSSSRRDNSSKSSVSARARGNANINLTKQFKDAVFVTGAGGFVGKHLCSDLLVEGYNVFGTDMNVSSIPVSVNSVDIGAIDNATEWGSFFSDNKIHTIVHLAARVHIMNETEENPLEVYRKVNFEGTKTLAKKASEQGVKKFIFISTIKVNGEDNIKNKPFSANDIPNPTDPYGISKLEAEEEIQKICQESGMEFVIIRPPLMYGEGVKGNFLSLLKLVKTGLPLPLGMVKHNERSFLFVKNLCSLITNSIENPKASNKILLPDDGKPVSTYGLIKEIAIALSKSTIMLPVPVSLLNLLGKVTGRQAQIDRLCGSLKVDSQEVTQTTGWIPPYSFSEGIKETANWFKNL